jgi:hypothetical protein
MSALHPIATATADVLHFGFVPQASFEHRSKFCDAVLSTEFASIWPSSAVTSAQKRSAIWAGVGDQLLKALSFVEGVSARRG